MTVPRPPTPRLATVILAAGRGSRMGGRKMMRKVAGKRLVEHAVETAIAALPRPVIIVIGADADALRPILAGPETTVVVNHAVDNGLSSSLRLGLDRVPAGCAGAIVMLGDMPAVSPTILDALASTAALRPSAKAIVPTFEGRRGNPVLLLRSLFAAVGALVGDEGARSLLTGPGVVEMPVSERGILLDIDSQDDIARYEAELKCGAHS